MERERERERRTRRKEAMLHARQKNCRSKKQTAAARRLVVSAGGHCVNGEYFTGDRHCTVAAVL